MLTSFAFKLRFWVPLAVVITALCGLTYVIVQQHERQSINDQQRQIAEDLAGNISSGMDPKSPLLGPPFEITKTLTPFVIIYDQDGNESTGNARLDGKTPEIPKGVFEYAKKYGTHTVTWQPQKGVRSATVITHFANPQHEGYVLVGKSLRETERRTRLLHLQVTLAWLVTLATSLLAVLIFIPDLSKTHKKP